MTILHIARLYLPHVGGVEKHLQKINESFIKDGHSVSVLTSQYENHLSLVDEESGVQIFRISNGSRFEANSFTSKLQHKLQTWKGVWQYFPQLLKSDVIHIHDVMWWVLPFYPFIWKKIFITFHGHEGSEAPSWRQIFWHRLAANLVRGNLCVGGFHEKWYGLKPDITTFGAVEISPRKNENKNLKNTIMFLGRLEPENGILKYLSALKDAKKMGHTWSLDVYGDGCMLDEAKTYAQRHGLNVKFLGFVPNAQKYIQNYEMIFVCRYLGILEAMLARKKIISQFINGITQDYLEISPFKDWITIAHSSDEIKEELLEKKVSYSKVGYEWARQQSWKNMVANYYTLWKK